MEYIKNKDGTFTCAECGVVKNHQSTMYYHMKSKHYQENKYECEHCDKEFMQKSMLKAHMNVHHSNNPTKYSCCCGHVSTTKGNLQIHIARAHLSNRIDDIHKERTDGTHKCTECKHTCNSMTSFYYHALQCITIPKKYADLL
jgi:hypothetical protein